MIMEKLMKLHKFDEEEPEEVPGEEPEKEPVKETPKEDGMREMLAEKFLKTRTILIFGEINQRTAQTVTEQLLLLSTMSDEDIKIIINSPGGHVESGYTIFDMIRFVKPKVKVIGTGWVASAAALIYLAPPAERRFSLPNTRFLIHQPMGAISGSARDLAIEAEEIVKMRKKLNELISQQTGQSIDKVEHDTDRNFWMNADEAINYGVVGKIVETSEEV
jgi:ATP-dependent Clp protease protease subunit